MKKHSLSNLVTLSLSVLMAGGTATVLSACGDQPYDYTKDIKLTLDYEGHNFFEDGIGEVKLFTHIDGDTDHYKCIVGDTTTTLKSRYYGIDTPESTGAIQCWGQEASDFTKSQVTAANEHGTIVVSSPFNYYGAPTPDSTGSRFLSLVWINTEKEHAPKEELTLLNLLIVQEGWSWAKNLSDIPEYVDTFQNAQAQAEKYKKGMWTDDPCPLPTDRVTTSCLALKNEVANYLKDQSYENKMNGANVKFTGVVSGFCDNVLYVQEECWIDPNDESLGMAWGGINIFTGMTAISSKYTTVGTYLSIIGTAKDSENFGFQVTNTQGHFPVAKGDPETDCQVLLTPEENDGEHRLYTFQYTAAEQNAKLTALDFENLYCRTHITNELVCKSFYINDAKTEVTLRFEGADFSVYLPFQYSGNPDDPADVWMTAEKFVGKKFDVSGVLSYHKSQAGKISYQIIPCGSADLVCLEDSHGTTSGSPFSVSEAWTACNNATTESTINYYVKGKISQVKGNNTYAISDGSKSVNVKVENYNGVEASELVVGSTISAFGVVSNADGGTFNKATVYSCSPHGALIDDTLTIGEAEEIAASLSSGESSSIIYYISGNVTVVDKAYDTSSKRMSITISDGTHSVTVNPKMGTGIDYNDVTVGANVIVRGKLSKNGSSWGMVDNGCQVVSVIK